MDRPVDSTTTEQAFVRGIDDRIDRQCRDVRDDDIDAPRGSYRGDVSDSHWRACPARSQ
jgi:hypothetical protein